MADKQIWIGSAEHEELRRIACIIAELREQVSFWINAANAAKVDAGYFQELREQLAAKDTEIAAAAETLRLSLLARHIRSLESERDNFEALATVREIEAEQVVRLKDECVRDYMREYRKSLKLEQENKRLRAALEGVSTMHVNYDHPENGTGTYGIGVTDGHRCAAKYAREALAATPPAKPSYLRCPYCIAGQCERCANDDICQCECRATAKPAEPRK